MVPYKRWFQLSGFSRTRGTDRFWRHVRKTLDPTACWNWTNGRSGSGYGLMWWAGRNRYAHRLAYELVSGPIPPGLVVRHLCDNPLCCRPTHLAVGQHRDNMADMARHGRARSRALSPAQVTAIRQRPEPATVLAAEFGVSPTSVQAVRRGETHRQTANA